MLKHLLFFALLLAMIGCSGKDDSKLTATGTIETTEVNITAKSPGQLIMLRVGEGSIVHQGDTLASVDTTIYALNYRQSLAAIAQAEAQLLLLEHGTRHEDIEQSAELVKQAQVNLKNAKEDELRVGALLKENAATKKQHDDAVTRVDALQATFNAAEDNYQKLKSGARPEDISAAKARLDQVKGQSNQLLQTVHDCNVIAPVSGMVTHKVLSQGELASPSATIVTISVTDPVKLTIYISDKDLGKVKLGQTAEVGIDTYKDKKFAGKVIYISPQAEFTPKNVQSTEDREKLVFAVKIEVPNADGSLKPGMPADATLK
ncbi:MAG: efflux RND transporter periplasmic adaptor subunit [bacterium]